MQKQKRVGGFLLGSIHSLPNRRSVRLLLHSSISSNQRNTLLLLLLPNHYTRAPSTRRFSNYSAAEQFSDDEYVDFESHKASSTVANIDEWKWKLNMLSRNEKDQEIVSRDKRDRRDYEQISNLAKRMGLYSELYGKVVVASKVPLPNYRPDLDDKRPQREVVLPLSLQRRVEGLLQEHLDRTLLSSGKLSESSDDGKPVNQTVDMKLDDPDSFLDGSVMEKVLQRRSLRMRNMQRAWLESPEGKKMLDLRKSLPAFKEKERLLQAIARNQVIVISGETGCGKTTQIPQYVLESEIESGRGAFCSIICTQPRRISAMSVAERVSSERGEPLGETVGYKVRLEGMKGKNTHLLFCTSGILLRRLLSDHKLEGITHVFVDEIHERGMNEDFLLIVLKDLLPRRQDLRLILMSATLNAELFSNYFGGAPTIHVPGFTYPVRAHFLEDVLEMTGYKLTSFNQIDDYGQDKMWKTHKQLVPRKRKNQITALVEDALNKSSYESYSPRVRDSLACWLPDCIGFNLIEAVLCHICRKERPGAVLVFMTGWEDISCLRDQLKAHPLLGDPNRVLLITCHGSMATSEQKLIFAKAALNVRKVVLATNMAEASITINDIVFVVDCGKAKETTYDALNNTPCLLPSWISQASARQRKGRAGRVQPGECYHLYPKCVYEAFAEFQLPELLRTPLNSLCLQIKSLQVGSIGDFLSAALQPPEPLAVQNAIDFLKMIGSLDEKENLTDLGKFLSMLPVDPKLGKMLVMGSIFRCFDPVLTIVSGLSVRDPFLLPQDKKDLAGTAKSRFSAKDYSDHMAVVRAYEGWKDAEREGSSYEYCWRNFLSAQTLQAIHSLRKQFSFILKDAGLLDDDVGTNNRLSHNQSLVRAIICSGLFPGIASVVHRETSMSFKTMDDGQVLLYANSVNARYQTITYPWLVFGEKVKVNAVFIRDSTGVSDSILMLFGGVLCPGVQAGHLKMLDGYIDFFMDPSLAECYMKIKQELDKLLQKKFQDPSVDIHKEGKYLMLAIQELVSGDQCEGRYVFGRESKKHKESNENSKFSKDGRNPKSLLQTLLMRAGHSPPKYKTKHIKTNEFRALVEFKGMQFVGKPKKNKQLSERDAAVEALAWLTHTSDNIQNEDDDSPPDVTDNMLKLLGKRRRSKGRSG
ncbi:dsrm domain-containing protein/DEAD domain-containing protein/Helicase_C domain-containing protein/HA2 domain-containing protein/OB_NTP_bind domain-containing protein [Cephalotus follicularis]|uniref:RNA helicase n=1 Tax=Cephalotus follicularis TaxID=3775 RepID=A0A1Q3CZJ2_CEPFO|nr:dsrm domain-containing protein/DEAD domain-containing protein/Helicase_C domain-containing protein/HA2 domain-containing protein/OB_NTP_bind domain-containing protein [Cephalotus follicularis]